MCAAITLSGSVQVGPGRSRSVRIWYLSSKSAAQASKRRSVPQKKCPWMKRSYWRSSLWSLSLLYGSWRAWCIPVPAVTYLYSRLQRGVISGPLQILEREWTRQSWCLISPMTWLRCIWMITSTSKEWSWWTECFFLQPLQVLGKSHGAQAYQARRVVSELLTPQDFPIDTIGCNQETGSGITSLLDGVLLCLYQSATYLFQVSGGYIILLYLGCDLPLCHAYGMFGCL